MAEEAPKVQNKGLLLVAVALGAVVVIIYNLHITAVRNEGKGEVVRLLRLTTAKNINDPLEDKDLEEVPIQKSDAERLGNVVPLGSKGFVLNRRVRENLTQGQWLLWGHLEGTEMSGILKNSPKGTIVITLEVSQKNAPGPILEPGGKVILGGYLSVAGKPPRYFRIIQGVKVIATGSNTLPQPGDPVGLRERGNSRSYRTIAVEMDQRVVPQWMNIQSRLGEVMIEVVPPNTTISESVAGKINPEEPELVKMADSAVVGRPESGGFRPSTP